MGLAGRENKQKEKSGKRKLRSKKRRKGGPVTQLNSQRWSKKKRYTAIEKCKNPKAYGTWDSLLKAG